MSHSDCATYGGLAHFKGDREAEADITAANSSVRRTADLKLPTFRSSPTS